MAVDLRARNTLGLPCLAHELQVITSLAQLQACFPRGDEASLLVLAGGSNVVLPEAWPGRVLQPALRGRQVREEKEAVLIQVGAGEPWPELVRWTLAQGWSGLENLSDIPGWAGAAPLQNIGAYGVELSDVLQEVQSVDRRDGRLRRWQRADCALSYRDSIFKGAARDTQVIAGITLRLPRRAQLRLDYGDLRAELDRMAVSTVDAQAVATAVSRLRARKLPDPALLGNAGSFFKNPIVSQAQADALARQEPGLVAHACAGGQKLAAAWLIDRCGLRGQGNGKVACHRDQALVLVNLGAATAGDVLAWAGHVQDCVRQRFAVELEIEPRVYASSR